MATTIKISQLPPAASAQPTSFGPFDVGGQTYQVTAQQIYDANRREGIRTAAPADGSASVTISFSPAFSSSLISLNSIAFVNYSGSDVPVWGYIITGASANGFTIKVAGGANGSTVDIHYGATGE